METEGKEKLTDIQLKLTVQCELCVKKEEEGSIYTHTYTQLFLSIVITTSYIVRVVSSYRYQTDINRREHNENNKSESQR